MGSIEKRGKNTWRIGVRVKGHTGWGWVRTTLHMDPALSEAVQRRDAERELTRLEARLAAEAQTDYTLRAWADEWLAKIVGPDCSPVTVHNYRHLLDSRILPILGDYHLQELTPALLTDWLIQVRNSPRRSTRLPDEALAHPRARGERLVSAAQREKPLSASTVQHYYTCMEAMLAAAVRLGYLEHNPMDRVQRPRARRKKLATLSAEDAVALIAALGDIPADPLRLSVLLALTCGLRLGEVCALRYEDIDFRAHTLAVSRALKYTPGEGTFISAPKTAAGDRVITLPPTLLRALQESQLSDRIDEDYYRDIWQGEPDGHYILHDSLGRRLHHDTPSKWFRRFADEQGFSGVRFHDLRHAHASFLVAAGIDVAAIAARMGHGDASVTLRTYAHALAPRDQAAAATLDTLLQPSPDKP